MLALYFDECFQFSGDDKTLSPICNELPWKHQMWRLQSEQLPLGTQNPNGALDAISRLPAKRFVSDRNMNPTLNARFSETPAIHAI